jgi:hypothetical protein
MLFPPIKNFNKFLIGWPIRIRRSIDDYKANSGTANQASLLGKESYRGGNRTARVLQIPIVPARYSEMEPATNPISFRPSLIGIGGASRRRPS